MNILCLILGLFFTLQALAWPPTYGAEFEITHPSIESSWEHNGKEQAADAKILYVKNLAKICKSIGCRIEAVEGKWQLDTIERSHDYKITMPDGWWFKVSHDPGCIEITTKPSTQLELKDRATTINSMIFDSGIILGFESLDTQRSHFNIGFKSAFQGSSDLFLRFFVDYQNRPELALGALGKDIHNGPPLAIMSDEMRKNLVKIVKQHNEKPITDWMTAQLIQKEVYLRPYIQSWGSAEHYQAIGLKHVVGEQNFEKNTKIDKPFELRAIWNQTSAEDFILLAELFEARIAYLKKQTTPIVYTESSRKENFSKLELIAGFYNYVTESGLQFQKFKTLLPEHLQRFDMAEVYAKATEMRLNLDSELSKALPGQYSVKQCSGLF